MLQHRSLGARVSRRSTFSGARSRVHTVKVQAAALPKWEFVFNYLAQEKKLRSIEPAEAKDMVASGKWVLVDVRPPAQHTNSRPAGAINIPMYQPIDWSQPDVGKVFKFVAYSFNGVSPVEPNPQFVEQIKAATDNGTKGIITLCEAGGTLSPTTNFPLGKASRSLQAAYRAFTEASVAQVAHLNRGVYGWYQADLEFEGEGEYTPELGRTPMAAAEPMLQNIRASSGYAVRPDDKKK